MTVIFRLRLLLFYTVKKYLLEFPLKENHVVNTLDRCTVGLSVSGEFECYHEDPLKRITCYKEGITCEKME